MRPDPESGTPLEREPLQNTVDRGVVARARSASAHAARAAGTSVSTTATDPRPRHDNGATARGYRVAPPARRERTRWFRPELCRWTSAPAGRIAAAALSAWAVLALSSTGAAQDPTASAREAFAHGVELFDGGKYAEALLEFQRAYRKRPHCAVLYNVGLTHLALGDDAKAADAFEAYLSSGGDRIPASRRQQVERDLARLEQKVAVLTLSGTPGMDVTLDGVRLERAGPGRGGPGAPDGIQPLPEDVIAHHGRDRTHRRH